MDVEIKQNFLTLWNKYFNGTELPITFYYSINETGAHLASPPSGRQCFISQLSKVRRGESLAFDANSIGCPGGKRYLGFADSIRPQFEYFLSCGIPGKLEGERYKKSPELVKQLMEKMPTFKAPANYIIFKRWDKLEEDDIPEVVIFFAPPNVLSGLFTLANFDKVEPAVIVPFGSGCSTIIQYPYLQKDSESPKAIIGMFDVSARPCVPEETLSFAVPMKRFHTMITNMEESFLITDSWNRVYKQITKNES